MADYTYKPYALTLHTDAMGSAVHLPDILSKGIQVNSRDAWATGREFSDAEPRQPRWSFADCEYVVFRLGDAARQSGIHWPCDQPDDESRHHFVLAKFNKNGFAESSNHRSYTFRKGIIVPKRLTVSHRDDARLEFDVVPIFDGTNNAIVVSDAASLPSIAINPALDARPDHARE